MFLHSSQLVPLELYALLEGPYIKTVMDLLELLLNLLSVSGHLLPAISN